MSGEGDMEAFAFSSEGTRVQISKGVKASEHLGAGAGSASMPSLSAFIEDTGVPFDRNFNSILRKDHQKKFLWTSRLWVSGRIEPILGYVPKNGERNNFVIRSHLNLFNYVFIVTHGTHQKTAPDIQFDCPKIVL